MSNEADIYRYNYTKWWKSEEKKAKNLMIKNQTQPFNSFIGQIAACLKAYKA